MFGGPLIVPVPDVDRTDFLLVLGANPYASNGSLATAPDWPGRIEAMRARGGRLVVVDPRRSRTAEEADEWIADPPGHRPVPARRDGPHDPRRGPRRPGRRRRFRRAGSTASARRLAPLRRRSPWPSITGIDAATIRRLARELAAAPIGRGLRADRHDHRRVRHRGELARRRAQHPHRQPRPTGRGDVHHAGRRPARTRMARRGPAEAFRLGTRSLTGARTSADDGRVARRLPGRGDRDAGRRPAPGPGHRRRQPGAVAAQRRPPRRRARRSRVHGVRRHLRQRDHPPRRRHPAGAVGAAEAALRRRAAAARRAQRRQLVRRRCCRSTTASPTSGRSSLEAGADRPRGRAPTPTRRSSTTSPSARWSSAAVADEHGPLFGRDADEILAALGAAHRARPDRRLHACAAGHTATRSARARAGSPSTSLIAAPHGIDFGPLVPRLPDGLRTPSGMIEIAPEPILADLPRLASRRGTGPPTASCSSAGATCARTTRGCTTSRCS